MKSALKACLFAAVMLSHPARACTTFCYADGGTLVFGRNYDWNVGDGLVFVNKRDVTKRALVETGGATWTSKYGSVTFNQYGREFPTGGMNEQGLVVELMWLDETVYPARDERAALTTLQWIQYQLDNAATVGEVLKSDREVRIVDSASARIHFLIADAKGGVATIEFLAGRMVAHHDESLPYPVLTNDTYENSVAFARKAGRRSGKTSGSSLDRFARAASHEKRAATPADAVRDAFAMLDDVSQGEYTQWSIVYDIRNRRAHFRTHVARDVRWIDLAGLAFACDTKVAMLDINQAGTGDMAKRLEPYQAEANRKLVRTSFAKTPFLNGVPADVLDGLAQFPESTTCAPAPTRQRGD